MSNADDHSEQWLKAFKETAEAVRDEAESKMLGVADIVTVDASHLVAADPSMFTGTWLFNETPWFPTTITLSPDLVITLHADGKWEGSIEGLREHLATQKTLGTDVMSRLFLWLLLRAMESDARFW
jgi:hypothetical protein